MKQLHNKLHSNKGETLVETMAAILIFTLSSIVLMSMVTTASGINSEAKKSDAAISAELNAAEAQTNGSSSEIKIEYSDKTQTLSQTVKVDRFPPSASSAAGKLYSYSCPVSTPAPN